MPQRPDRWRVVRGIDLADGRRIDAGSHVEKLTDGEVAILSSKGAIQPYGEPLQPMPADPQVDVFEDAPPARPQPITSVVSKPTSPSTTQKEH